MKHATYRFTPLGLFLFVLGCYPSEIQDAMGGGDDDDDYDACVDAECGEDPAQNKGTLDITGPGSVPEYLTGIEHSETFGGPKLETSINGDLRSADQVAPENKVGCAPFAPAVFQGVVALIERGGCSFENKVNHAETAGAIAVVFINNENDLETAFAGDLSNIPSTLIGQADGQAIVSWCAEHPNDATVAIHPAQ